MKPLVSVIMPAYNGEQFIKESIDSIVNQTYENWELIVVDDSSTDGTVNIIENYTDPRIKLYRNECNKGISYSTNYAIDKSSGKYLALLDDDDLATANRLELQTEYLEEHHEIDILGGRSVCIDERGIIIKHDYDPLRNPKMIKAWMHFANRRFSNGTTTIRTEFVRKNNLRFKEDYYGIQDFKFIADSSKVGNISSIDRILQFKRIHEREATDYYIEKYGDTRKEKYAQLQRESIYDSGFRLTDEELRVINELLPEGAIKPLDYEQVKILIRVLDKMVQQARDMKVDYFDELNVVCRNIIIERFLHPMTYEQLTHLLT